MKNIFLLPTDQPSRLVKDLNGVFSLMGELIEVGGPICNINIYITSDEEIKEGDWYLDTFNTQRIKANEFSDHKHYGNACKKIIFTTDFRIAPDVQKIDDEFLEWFVKNPICEEVETIHGLFNPMGRQVDPMNLGQNHSQCVWKYKIIIPKEEPKQETLEEAAKNYIKLPLHKDIDEEERYYNPNIKCYDAFIEGAKWQAENMYSKEEVMDMFHKFSMHLPLHYEFLVREQFKKK